MFKACGFELVGDQKIMKRVIKSLEKAVAVNNTDIKHYKKVKKIIKIRPI